MANSQDPHTEGRDHADDGRAGRVEDASFVQMFLDASTRCDAE